MTNVRVLHFALVLACLAVGAAHNSGEQMPQQTAPSEAKPTAPVILASLVGGLFIPVVLYATLDVLNDRSSSRPNGVLLPKAVMVIHILTYFGSLVLCVILVLYAVWKQSDSSMDLVSACVGLLIANYATGFSFSSSLNLCKILFCKQFDRLPPASRYLLPNALRKLNQLAIRLDLWATMPFSEYLQLVLFALQLGDEQLLETLFDAESLKLSTNNLRQLHERLPEFQRLLSAGNLWLPDTFKSLVRIAMRTERAPSTLSSSVSVAVRADFAILFMDVGYLKLLSIIFSPEFGATNASAGKLCHLHARLPPLTALSEQGRRYLPAALENMLQLASHVNCTRAVPPYAVQVELIFLYLKEVGKVASSRQVIVWMDSLNVDGMQAGDVYDEVEGCWIRDWVHQFHDPLSSSSSRGTRPSPDSPQGYAVDMPIYTEVPDNRTEGHEAQSIRRVMLLYRRIKRAGSTYEDTEHLNMYKQIMLQDGEQILAH